MKGYQLTINNKEFLGYELEVLHQCEECPQYHLEQIAMGVYEKLENFGVNFVALSLECGSHVHLHIYCQLAYKPQSMSAWQKMFPGVHVEECRGTPAQNMDYLAKRGKWENDVKHGTLRWGPIEYGEMLQSERGTPEDYVKLAMQASSPTQVFMAYPESIRYSYAIKLMTDERGKAHGNDD